MSDGGNITYSPTPCTTPDQALDARSRAWAFIFGRWHEKKAAPRQSRPDAGKEINEQSGNPRIPQQG